jgi:uncharacterized protein (DUF1778 family)
LWGGYVVATVGHMAGKRKSPQKGTKDEVVRMRITATEKAALEEAAKADGLNLSVWLRRLALRAAGVIGTGNRP